MKTKAHIIELLVFCARNIAMTPIIVTGLYDFSIEIAGPRSSDCKVACVSYGAPHTCVRLSWHPSHVRSSLMSPFTCACVSHGDPHMRVLLCTRLTLMPQHCWHPCHCTGGTHDTSLLAFMPLHCRCSCHCTAGTHETALVAPMLLRCWHSCHFPAGTHATALLAFMPLHCCHP